MYHVHVHVHVHTCTVYYIYMLHGNYYIFVMQMIDLTFTHYHLLLETGNASITAVASTNSTMKSKTPRKLNESRGKLGVQNRLTLPVKKVKT